MHAWNRRVNTRVNPLLAAGQQDLVAVSSSPALPRVYNGTTLLAGILHFLNSSALLFFSLCRSWLLLKHSRSSSNEFYASAAHVNFGCCNLMFERTHCWGVLCFVTNCSRTPCLWVQLGAPWAFSHCLSGYSRFRDSPCSFTETRVRVCLGKMGDGGEKG